MIYGLDRNGGFYAIDHTQRRAIYAYPTSSRASLAKRNLDRAARDAAHDLESWCGPESIETEHYIAVCRGAGVSHV